MNEPPATPAEPPAHPQDASANANDQLATLFDLGRQVMSVLEIDELLPRIPELIGRLIGFDAFAVYLVDDRGGGLRIAYAVGYPPDAIGRVVLKAGEGLVGRSVADGTPLLVNDLGADPRYVAIAEGMQSELVVPLLAKGKPIGALNILSRRRDGFAESNIAILRQFGSHVAAALMNARLFELERREAEVFEALAEIGREVAAILDLDALLDRIVQLARRLIDYRTFGIMLVNDETGELEMKVGFQYGERVSLPRVRMGAGLVGHAALHRVPVLVNDVSRDARYIKVVDDVRSELVVPLLVRDRAIGVFDLESPELDKFDKRDVEILTLLAAQVAVSIENARLYAKVRANEARLDKEVRFAQRVQAGLLPTALPKRLRGVDVAARFLPARELGGDFYDFLSPEAYGLVVAVGDVSGKGVAAALYSAFAGELVRSRTFRRRYTTERTSPAAVLGAMNSILLERQLEHYFCTLFYANFDLRQRRVVVSNSGLPYPIRATADACEPIALPGVPLGLFEHSTYDEIVLPLDPGDVFVFATDGIYELANAAGDEFGAERLSEAACRVRHLSARGIVDGLFGEAEAFRGDQPQADDMTMVVVKVGA